MLKRLTDSDCLLIVEDYLSGSQTKYAVCKKYGICMGSISRWLRKFGLEDKSEETMKEKQLGWAGSTFFSTRHYQDAVALESFLEHSNE